MSLPDFLQRVRTAAGFLSPHATSGEPRGDEFRRALKGACIWLSPASVKGFDPNDLVVFPADKRARLTANVERFLAVARTAPGDKPVTDEQYRSAFPAFMELLSDLEPFLDWEAIQFSRFLEMQSWPPFVVGFSTETGNDSTGDPAFWVWVVLDDEKVDAADFGEVIDDLSCRVESLFDKHLQQKGKSRNDVWLYVRFRSLTEERSLLVGQE